MKMLRILIVEDEPLVAMDLEIMVTEIVTAAVVVEASVAATKKVLHESLDFAFLDVDVTNGKTFEVAQILERKRVPFVFISGSQNSCLLTCAACPSFPSLFMRLRLRVRCRLSGCRKLIFTALVNSTLAKRRRSQSPRRANPTELSNLFSRAL